MGPLHLNFCAKITEISIFQTICLLSTSSCPSSFFGLSVRASHSQSFVDWNPPDPDQENILLPRYQRNTHFTKINTVNNLISINSPFLDPNLPDQKVVSQVIQTSFRGLNPVTSKMLWSSGKR